MRRKRRDDAAPLRRKILVAAASVFHRERKWAKWARPDAPPPNRAKILAAVRSVYGYWNRSGRICYLCYKPIGAVSDASIDHVVPPCRGGTSSALNLGIAHRRCSVVKDIMTLEEYRKFMHAIRCGLNELVLDNIFRRLYVGGKSREK